MNPSPKTPVPSLPPLPPAQITRLPARTWWVVGVLMLITLLGRTIGLMDLPIFSDEGIYLRWAQLIRQNWMAHAFVSLVDPKPPLHYWLLATIWNWASDPLLAGRMLSVMTAVLLVPAVVLLCRELEFWYIRSQSPTSAARDPGTASGLITALLMICCPFLAFNQRLALADGLFALQIVTCAWLSLRMARTVGTYLSARLFWTQSLPFGIVLGLTMLTRQIISYELWALPVLGFVFGGFWRRDESRFFAFNWPAIKRFSGTLLVAFIIGCTLWSPFLLVNQERYHPEGIATNPVTKESFSSELRRRILYQPHFSEAKPLSQQLHLIKENFIKIAIPTRGHGPDRTWALWGNQKSEGSDRGDLTTGWYWIYLTPVVFVGSLLSLVYLALRHRWRWVLLLGTWEFLMIGPLILLGDVSFSRYTLAGVPPLLIGLGLALTQLLESILLRCSPHSTHQEAKPSPEFLRWGAVVGLLLLVLAWPAWEIHKQNTQWRTQTLTVGDRYQYVTGWTGGQASMQAVHFLQNGGHVSTTQPGVPSPQKNYEGPMIVITANGWGHPEDAVQVYLRQRPHTQVYYVDWAGREPILRSLGDGTYRILPEKWLYLPEINITIPDGVPVFYVGKDQSPGFKAWDFIAKHDPIVDGPWFMENPRDIFGQPSADRVVVVRLR